MAVDICPAVWHGKLGGVPSGGVSSWKKLDRSWDVNEAIDNAVQQYKLSGGAALYKGLPSKISNHLAGAAGGVVVSLDESGCSTLDCL